MGFLEVESREEGLFGWGRSGFGPNGNDARGDAGVCDLEDAWLNNEVEIVGAQKVDPISPAEPRGDTGGINGTRWKRDGGKRKGEA